MRNGFRGFFFGFGDGGRDERGSSRMDGGWWEPRKRLRRKVRSTHLGRLGLRAWMTSRFSSGETAGLQVQLCVLKSAGVDRRDHRDL